MRKSARVILALPVGAAFAATALAAPASAATYPPKAPKCTITPGTATTGGTVSIVGVGYTPGSTVTVTGSGSAVVVSTTGKADSSGNVAISGKAGSPGSGSFTLSSGTQSSTCSVKIDGATVLPTSATRTSPPAALPVTLPNTGASGIGLELGIGGLLVLGGAGALVLSTRRRSA